jgi:type IV pilus assembly protein PilC
MPIFEYIAQDRQSQQHRGTLDARQRSDAVQILRAKKWIVLELDEANKAKKNKNNIRMSPSWIPVSTKDIVSILKQLRVMVRSGLSLHNAISNIEQECAKPKLKAKLKNVSIGIQTGKTFSEALAEQKNLFSDTAIRIIETAEKTGQMEQALDRVASALLFWAKLKKKTLMAMVYPMIVLMMAMIANSYLVFVFVPDLYEKILKPMGKPLPPLTQALVNFSNFGKENWLLIMIGFFVTIVGFLLTNRTPRGKRLIESALLRTPVIGKAMLMSTLAKFSGTMSVMLNSGISIMDAIDSVAKMTQVTIFKQVFTTAFTRIMSGMSLRDAIQNNYFPPSMYGILSAGENSGVLYESFDELERYYSDELEALIDVITNLLSPCILITVGIVVGVVYIAMFSAIVAYI